MTSVDTLIEALPYIREFRGETFVIRCPTRLSEADRKALSRDVAMLRFVGVKAVVVHAVEEPSGQGDSLADQANVNHRLVHAIGEYGNATGLAGSDGAPGWLLSIAGDGELIVNPDLVLHVIADYTPVVEAVAVGPKGEAVPADPDLAAARLASALGAYKVLFVLGDHRVVIKRGDHQGEVSEMRATSDVISLIEIDGQLNGPFQAAVDAVHGGVKYAHLIPSDLAHAMLVELFTERGYGTKIRSEANWAEAEKLEEDPYPPRGYFCWDTDPREDVQTAAPD